MRNFNILGERHSPGESSEYYPIPNVECGWTNVFREAPIDETDPEAVAQRNELREAIYALIFGTAEEREKYGSKCYPFNELPPDAVAQMPEALRLDYEAELAYSRDPRSGRIVRPYIPPEADEEPSI